MVRGKSENGRESRTGNPHPQWVWGAGACGSGVEGPAVSEKQPGGVYRFKD